MEDTNQAAPSANAGQSRPSPRTSSILAEGWRVKENIKNIVYKRYVLILLILIALVAINIMLNAVLGLKEDSAGSSILSIIFNIISTIVPLMLLVPVNVICIRNAIRLSLDMNVVKTQCSSMNNQLLLTIIALNVAPVIILFIVVLIGVLLPVPLFVILVILTFLALFYVNLLVNVLTLPHIVLRQMNFTDAFASSLKKFKRYFLLFNFVYGSIAIVQILLSVAATLIVGLGIYYLSLPIIIVGISAIFAPYLWILPWMHAVNGIVFRDLYGLKVNEQAAVVMTKSNSTYYLLALVVLLTALVVTPVYKFADSFISILMTGIEQTNTSMTRVSSSRAQQELFEEVSPQYKSGVISCFKANKTFTGCNEGVNGIPNGFSDQGQIERLTVKDGVITVFFKPESDGSQAIYYESTPIESYGSIGWSTIADINRSRE